MVPELAVFDLRAEWNERAPPPLHVMVAGNHEHRRRPVEFLHQKPGRLKFTVSGPQREVAGKDGDVRFEVGYEVLDGRDFLEVGHVAEVNIRQVNDAKTHTLSSSLPLPHDPAHCHVAQHIPDRHAGHADESSALVRWIRNENVETHCDRGQPRDDPRRSSSAPLDLRGASAAQLPEWQLDFPMAPRALMLNQAGD